MRAGLVVAAAVACSHPPPLASHSDVRTASPLASVGLPAPPQQLEAWTPGASLSPELARATALLFAQGLADPRGLDYREVEIAIGASDDYTTTPIAAHTHAWVFDGGRHAVAWNGLVYPVARAGLPADLRADVASFDRPRSTAWTEADAVSADRAAPLKAAMLARLGEDRAAVALAPAEAPYTVLASAWVHALLDRAIAAHGRRDHAMALASARRAAIAAAEVSAHGVTFRSFDGLDDIPRLIADEQRPSHSQLPDASVLAAMPVDERLDALVAHLDDAELHVVSFGQTSDRLIVPALVQIGPAAVERLLDVVASDARMTRSVEPSNGHLEMVGVETVAYQALSTILDHRFWGSGGDRTKLAVEMRVYWAHWRDVSTEEKWYRLLADDAAAPNDQVMAALSITEPTPTGLRGEVLRAHAAPTLDALFEHRIAAASALDDACYLANSFHRWDAAAAQPSLANLQARVIATAPDNGRGACVSQLAIMRDEAGDSAGVDDYARWLAQRQPDNYPETLLFEGAVALRARPAIAHAIDALFHDGSPWLPFVDPTGAHHDTSELVATELIEIASFNHQVAAALRDTRDAGTFEMADPDRYVVTIASGGGVNMGVDAGHVKTMPRAGTKFPIRACDWIAYQLVKYRSTAPAFELFWSQRRRDDAIAALRSWLPGQVK